MYRGQTEEFKPCLPSLGRIKANSQILLSLCRTVVFEEALGDHPLMSPAHLMTSAYFHEKEKTCSTLWDGSPCTGWNSSGPAGSA